jgi:hypothetical protein
MRRRPVGRCDRRPPGLPGGPLPGQQPHRGKRRPSQAHQGQALAGRRPDRVRLGRDPQPRHRPGRPAAGGWPAASASRKAAMAVGHPGPGDRLAPAHQRRRRPRSWPATSSSGATPTGLASEPSPSSRPSATASPSNPPPNTRRFTFQDSSAPRRGLAGGVAEQVPGTASGSLVLAGGPPLSRHGCYALRALSRGTRLGVQRAAVGRGGPGGAGAGRAFVTVLVSSASVRCPERASSVRACLSTRTAVQCPVWRLSVRVSAVRCPG